MNIYNKKVFGIFLGSFETYIRYLEEKMEKKGLDLIR